MRKFVLATAALMAFVGMTIAATVTFEKFDSDKKELTVTDGDKKVTYKVNKDTKVKRGDMDLDKEATDKLWKDWSDEEKSKKMAGKAKMDITVEKDVVTEIKLPERKKGNKGKDKN